MGAKMLDRGDKISVLVGKNLKLTAFTFKTIKHCFKTYDIRFVNCSMVLKYQHQWELEQKEPDNIEEPNRQEQLGKINGEYSVLPQAHERS